MAQRQVVVTALVAFLLGSAAGFWFGKRTDTAAQAVSAAAPVSAAKGAREVLFWRDPMRPEVHFDKGGRSPFMDMELVPVYADEAAADTAGLVQLTAAVEQRAAMRVASATRGSLRGSVNLFGTVVPDERTSAVVQARADGYVRKLLVRTPYASIRAGEPMVEVVIPSWSSAFREYLTLRATAGVDMAVKKGARDRLTQVGISNDLIEQIEQADRFDGTITLHAPRAGVVTEIGVTEGSAFAPGTVLFRVNGQDTVWVNAQVPESQTAGLAAGAKVTARFAALPGQEVPGRVDAVLPDVDRISRTRTLRIVLGNPDHRLVPGMSLTAQVEASTVADAVVVPAEAIIRTGSGNRVVVALGGSRYQVQPVTTGLESGVLTQVVDGLAVGQSVVVSGQFLIDAEAEMRGSTAHAGSDSAGGAAAGSAGH